MKRFAKGAEKAFRDGRDAVKEAAKDVKAAVDSGLLKDATSDQRAASHSIVATVQTQMKDAEAGQGILKAGWDALFKDPFFPTKYSKEAIQAKIAAVEALLATVRATAKQIEDKLHEITGRPNDGSTSASRAEADCVRLLGEQQALQITFTAQLKAFTEALDELNTICQVLSAETSSARVAVTLANLTQGFASLTMPSATATPPGPALTASFNGTQAAADGLPKQPDIPGTDPAGAKFTY